MIMSLPSPAIDKPRKMHRIPKIGRTYGFSLSGPEDRNFLMLNF